MDVAADLRAEARATDERRLLVLTGEAKSTRDAAIESLDAADIEPDNVTYLGTADDTPWKHVEPKRASELLGTTHDAVVLDCHDECRPNALGRAVGAVDGGGLLVLLTPPLDAWPNRRDDFDESLAVPPFEVSEVAGNFRSRLVSLFRAHPGIAIVDVDDSQVRRDGLTDPAPRLTPQPPTSPENSLFPASVYDRCRTQDQVDAVADLERLRERGQALVVEADRGRGKSSAAGLAAGALALEGRDVLVTAPQYRNAAEVFERAREVLEDADALSESASRGTASEQSDRSQLATADGGTIRFERPTDAGELPDDPDVVIVDEAAALPVRILERFLDAPSVVFATTVHGYEGAGRGFSVRFRDRLDESELDVTEVRLVEPIRYAAADPIESWAFRALLLDASPAVDQLVSDATPETVTYEQLDADDLLADEHLLREIFGLLVLAHYRTEPDDLARLLDAPNLSVRVLTHGGHVVSVALLAREGDLPADLRAHMYEGGRIRGNMIPDVLTSQLRDEDAGIPVGERVLRIATHHAVRSRGLGSLLLDRIHEEVGDEVDWLGTGFGATPELLRFWRASGFETVHLSSTRNDASGEYSAVMLRPTSDEGQTLADRHARWFCRRIPGVLSDPLADMDPDVVREALRSVDANPPLDLDEFEWRLLAGMPHGAGIFDTAPRPLRRIAVRYLVDVGENGPDGISDEERLTKRRERLLVRKGLQGESWGSVTERLDYHSRGQCMRAMGGAVRPLLSRYGPSIVEDELERFEE